MRDHPHRWHRPVVALGALTLAGCSISSGTNASVDSAQPLGASTTALVIPTPSTTRAPGVTTTRAPAVPTSAVPTTAPAPTTVATTAPPPTSATPTTVAAATGIAGVNFENFTYDLGVEGGPLALVQGAAQRGNVGDPTYVFARVQDVLKGDMDGDGVPEAAVTVLYNTGGTGEFTDVYVYRWNGSTPVLVGTAGTGDRAFDGVRGTTLVDGKLVIERYGGADGACCPTTVVRRAFTVGADALVPAGPARTWALVYLDRDPTLNETPIRFLPGTNGAYLSGVAGQSLPGGFGARKGQRLDLEVQDLSAELGYASLDVVRGDSVLGTASVDAPLSLVLPEGGRYQIRVHADAKATQLAAVEAVLAIT
jgi:hypothetical protein